MKFTQYGFAVVLSILLRSVVDKSASAQWASMIDWMGDGLIMFIIYIEFTSICENVHAIAPDSLMARYFFSPALRLLTFQIRNNPATQLPTSEK